MSESTQAQSGQSTSQSGSDESLEVTRTPEELTKRLKETAEEAKKHRQNNAELKARLDAIENERLAEQGKHKEMAEKYKARVEHLEKESRESKAKSALRAVESQVKAEATKLGCVDPDALLRLMDTSELDVDQESFSVEGSSMKSALEKLQKEKSYLFQKSAASHRDLPPGNGKDGFKPKTVKEMSLKEKLDMLNGTKK